MVAMTSNCKDKGGGGGAIFKHCWYISTRQQKTNAATCDTPPNLLFFFVNNVRAPVCALRPPHTGQRPITTEHVIAPLDEEDVTLVSMCRRTGEQDLTQTHQHFQFPKT